jgi:hypothetical protein
MKPVKKITPGTWAVIGFAIVAVIVTLVMVLPSLKLGGGASTSDQATIALYNNHSDTRKVNDRVEIAIRLNLSDKTGAKYPLQLEGRASGSWQVVKKYTATKPNNTVVFRVHPSVVGDIVYRAEIQTPTGIVTTNELLLHVTN